MDFAARIMSEEGGRGKGRGGEAGACATPMSAPRRGIVEAHGVSRVFAVNLDRTRAAKGAKGEPNHRRQVGVFTRGTQLNPLSECAVVSSADAEVDSPDVLPNYTQNRSIPILMVGVPASASLLFRITRNFADCIK